MKTRLDISISEPCSEKFNRFKPAQSGRFCKSCQKEVIDFRKMSDQQIINYFKNNNNETCGILKKSQLKNYEVDANIKGSRSLKYITAASLALFSLMSVSNANAQVPNDKTEISPRKTMAVAVSELDLVQGHVVTGMISDETSPIPGANIVLKNTTTGTTTNFDGVFKFPKPLKTGDVLVVSYIGYKSQEIVIQENLWNLNIVLKDEFLCMMGKVNVNSEVYKSKKTLWQKIKGIY